MPHSITIVDYNPGWPMRFEREKTVLTAILGHRTLAIEHIGSTAIPNMSAKAVVDIMVAVPTLTEGLTCVPDLERIGYDYRPELRHLLPNRLFFEKGSQEVRHFHLHMLEHHSDFWDSHLLSRDYLRRHQGTAEAYARLKRQLADALGQDRHASSTAKSEFVERIVRLARMERDSQYERHPIQSTLWA